MQQWKYSASPYSIFTCLDSIHKRTECLLCDWNWIEKDACTSSGAVLKMAPFTSSGWYFRGVTAYLLDRGKIQWDDILYGFNSTIKLPSDAFAKAITRVQEAFERCPGNTRSGQPTLSKHSVNAAVGAMESLDSFSFCKRSI